VNKHSLVTAIVLVASPSFALVPEDQVMCPIALTADGSASLVDTCDGGGGGGGGGGGEVPPPPWTPSYYRCTWDQLNNDQGRGRQLWAKRWANNDPYDISTTRDQRFWLTSYSPDASVAYDSYGMWLYPVYVDPSTYTPFLGPGAPNSSTAGYTGDQIYALSYVYKPVDMMVDGMCEPGCYAPDQRILFKKGQVSIQEAQQAGAADLMTLSPEATLDSIQLTQSTVERYTLDRDVARQDILVFRTESGGSLSVTLEHPLVTSEGTVKKARTFAVGEHLVQQDGTFDKIVSIEKKEWFGKVYNLRPVSKDLTSNILVAEGYLNGSGRFQSEYVEELNRVILRKNVPDELIPLN
jgi:hypothetical protein